MGSDGRWTSEVERERAGFLATQREAARAQHDAALREHKAAQDARLSWEASWESRLNDFVAGSRVEPLRREPGFVRVTMPSGKTLKCRRESVEELLANHLKTIERPAIPNVSEPPAMPTDDELLQGFAADRQTRRTLEWTARLTTQEGDVDLGRAPADDVGSGPSPRFVTETLNTLAADGWTVHHVGEDRAMINQSAEVVRVRYLLVASSS